MEGDDVLGICLIVFCIALLFFGMVIGHKIGEYNGMNRVALHVCNNAGYKYATVKEIDDKIEIFCYNETPLYEDGREK